MKIQESTVNLSASHAASRSQSVEYISETGFRQVFAQAAAAPGSPDDSLQQRVQHLLESLIEAILAAMDGRGCRAKPAAGCLPASAPPQALPVGRSFHWQHQLIERQRESESTQVAAHGQVRTGDGREIAFAVELNLSRASSRETRLTDSGSVTLRDPLVLSFAGSSCELTGQRFAFDLDADGRPEQIPGLGAGSCFLVLDRNGNGRADDGRELFGALSGDGFADLACLDDDGNGWIDEADAAFSRLALWSGDRWQSLPEGGVGALHAAAVDSPFTLKTAGHELLGELRSTGIYLSEAGQAGFLQHVDLAVSAPAGGTEEPAERQGLAG